MHVNFNDSATRHFRLESKPAVIDLTVDENEKKRKGVSTATNSEGGPQKKKRKKRSQLQLQLVKLKTELQEMTKNASDAKEKLARTEQAMYEMGDNYEEVREENKSLRASIRAAGRAHAAEIQGINSQLKLKTQSYDLCVEKLVQAQQNVNAKNVVIVKLSARIKDLKDHHEDELEKKVEERLCLQSSIDTAKRAHAAQIQDKNSQLKKKSDAMKTLKANLTEANAIKAEIESQLCLKIAELQKMTAKASDAEEREKSVGEKLAHELQAKHDRISEMNVKVEDMKGRLDDAMKREEALLEQLECLQSQMESRRKSNPNTRSCLEGNYTNKSGKKKKPKGKTIKRKVRAELEALMNTNDIPNVSLDDIIGQKTAKDALLDLKPFRDPAYECLYADDEDNSNSNTGILLHGPPGTVS